MSSVVRPVIRRYHLVGPREGQTITLNGVRFVEGVHEFRGPSNHADSLGVYLARSHNAHAEGEPLETARVAWERFMEEQNGRAPRAKNDPVAKVQAGGREGSADDKRPDDGAEAGAARSPAGGEGGPSTAGEVGEGSEPDVASAPMGLAEAVSKLDPANDDHWTQMGLPALSALGELAGSAGIKRADVEAVAPGYNRDAARAAKESE